MQTRAAPPLPLPPGREVRLHRRGTLFLREIEGPPGAPTLVLLHGLGANADLNWITCFDALGEQYRVVAPDMRGHGRGIRSRRHFRLADCADDVAVLCKQLGIDRTIPVGYSMGGPVAQLMWHRHRDLVQGMVLCATARNFRGAPHEKIGYRFIGGLAVAANVAPRLILHRVFAGLMPRLGPPDDPAVAWARTELERSDPRKILQATRTVGRFTSHRWIGELDVPAAVVLTLRDQLVPVHRQYKLARSIPDVTIHEVDADHMACGFAADRFVPALLEACASVVARS